MEQEITTYRSLTMTQTTSGPYLQDENVTFYIFNLESPHAIHVDKGSQSSGNWTCFSFLKTFHPFISSDFSSKRILQFQFSKTSFYTIKLWFLLLVSVNTFEDRMRCDFCNSLLTDSSFFHTAVCMRGSCGNSPHPPLCQSFRCGESLYLAPPLICLWR